MNTMPAAPVGSALWATAAIGGCSCIRCWRSMRAGNAVWDWSGPKFGHVLNVSRYRAAIDRLRTRNRIVGCAAPNAPNRSCNWPRGSPSSATVKAISTRLLRSCPGPTSTCCRAPHRIAKSPRVVVCLPIPAACRSPAVSNLRCGPVLANAKAALPSLKCASAPSLLSARTTSEKPRLPPRSPCASSTCAKPPPYRPARSRSTGACSRTHAVPDLAKAIEIIDWYRQRWHIEQLFWTLKSQGFDLEASQIETAEALMKLAIMATQAATRVMQLVRARDGKDPRPAEDLFSTDEINIIADLQADLQGRTERQKNPHPPRSLAWAAWTIARLGGWKGYSTSDGPPGPLIMRRGLEAFEKICRGYALARSVHRSAREGRGRINNRHGS